MITLRRSRINNFAKEQNAYLEPLNAEYLHRIVVADGDPVRLASSPLYLQKVGLEDQFEIYFFKIPFTMQSPGL